MDPKSTRAHMSNMHRSTTCPPPCPHLHRSAARLSGSVGLYSTGGQVSGSGHMHGGDMHRAGGRRRRRRRHMAHRRGVFAGPSPVYRWLICRCRLFKFGSGERRPFLNICRQRSVDHTEKRSRPPPANLSSTRRQTRREEEKLAPVVS